MNRFVSLSAVILPVAVLLASMTGCQTPEKDYDLTIARFFMEANPQQGYAENLLLPVSKAVVPVNPAAVITEVDIVSVDLVQVDMGLCMNFKVTPAAARDLYRLSVNNLGRRLVLTLNGTPYGVRQMNQPLSFGEIMIFAELSDEDLEEMVLNLQETTVDVQKEVARST